MVANMPVIISRYSNNSQGISLIFNEVDSSKDTKELSRESTPNPQLIEQEKKIQKVKKTLGYVERMLKLKFDSIKSAFNAFDVQGIMRVYPGQFKQCLIELGFVLPNNQYHDIFKLLDKDGFGYLTFSQFCQIYSFQLKDSEEPEDITEFQADAQLEAQDYDKKVKVQAASIDQLERLSRAPQTVYKGYSKKFGSSKNLKYKEKSMIPTFAYDIRLGQRTLPSDDMEQIMTNGFNKSYLEKR